MAPQSRPDEQFGTRCGTASAASRLRRPMRRTGLRLHLCACCRTQRCIHHLRCRVLVGDGRRSGRCRVLIVSLAFFSVCSFLFLGGESAARFLALPHLVSSEILVLLFFCFLWGLPTSSAGVESFGESKAECHELTSSGRSCVGQVPSGSMLAG